jgi:hypothetical protein
MNADASPDADPEAGTADARPQTDTEPDAEGSDAVRTTEDQGTAGDARNGDAEEEASASEEE